MFLYKIYSVSITLLLISIYSFSFAQDEVRVKVTTQNGDTFIATIDNHLLNTSPKDVKLNVDGKSLSFNQSITSILNMQTNVEYIYKTFQIEKLPRNADKTKFESVIEYAKREKNIKTETRLLKVLANGDVKLYEFTDFDMEEHLIFDINDELIPLVYHRIGLSNGNLEIKDYQNQIKNFFIKKCSNVSDNDISRLPYRGSELQTLVNDYNSCLQSNESPKQKVGEFQIGLSFDLGYNQMKYDYKYHGISLENHKINNSIGMMINYLFSQSNKRVTIINEFNYFKYSLVYKQVANDYYDGYEHKFTLPFVSYRPQIKFDLKQNSPLYIQAGLSLGLGSNQFHYSKSLNPYQTVQNKSAIKENIYGYLCSVGYAKNRIDISARLIREFGFNRNSYLNSFITDDLKIVLKYYPLILHVHEKQR